MVNTKRRGGRGRPKKRIRNAGNAYGAGTAMYVNSLAAPQYRRRRMNNNTKVNKNPSGGAFFDLLKKAGKTALQVGAKVGKKAVQVINDPRTQDIVRRGIEAGTDEILGRNNNNAAGSSRGLLRNAQMRKYTQSEITTLVRDIENNFANTGKRANRAFIKKHLRNMNNR